MCKTVNQLNRTIFRLVAYVTATFTYNQNIWKTISVVVTFQYVR